MLLLILYLKNVYVINIKLRVSYIIYYSSIFNNFSYVNLIIQNKIGVLMWFIIYMISLFDNKFKIDNFVLNRNFKKISNNFKSILSINSILALKSL